MDIAGELMRAPILEKAIKDKDIAKIEMSKTILTDECLSVGCSLYCSLLKGCFPIKNFKGIYHLNHYTIYTIFSSTNNSKIEEWISNHFQINASFNSFTFDKNLLSNIINISIL